VATLYQAHIWLNHLLFDASDYARQTRPRDLALSALFLAVVWGTLHLPGVRRILGISHTKTHTKKLKLFISLCLRVFV
jgi:hypothetical protein